MFDNGAEIVLVDFHMHTRKDKEFVYAGDENYFVNDYINAMQSNNIRIGIITNHNKFDLKEYKTLRKEARKRDILILPGVELSIKEGRNGLHTLIIFNPDEWIEGESNHIDNFLNIVFRDIHNRDNANTRCQTDVTATFSELEKYNRDYFVVFAHVEQDNGLLAECNGGMIKSLAETPYFHKRVLGIQKVRTRDKIPQLSEWLGFMPAMLEGSDPKNINDIGKTRGASLIKLGELSFAALKYALLDYKNRVFLDRIQLKHSYIKSITFQGGKLAGSVINLSPHLNTFIGIRGSGKSSILETLRYGLQIEPYVDDVYKKKLVNHVLDSGGKVNIQVSDEHGKSYTVSRINGENTTVLDHRGDDLAISVSTIVRNPLYFGQKDLAATGPGYEFDLLHKLVGSRVTAKEETISGQVNTMADKIRQLINISEIPGHIEELEEKERELEHKLTIFEEKGISEKLEKQTACNDDGIKLEEIIKEAKNIKKSLNTFLQQYDKSAVSLVEYTSKYNVETFQKLQVITGTFSAHMQEISKLSESIDKDITSMIAAQDELYDAIGALKEEFAEIRREIHDNSLDVESFGKYRKEKARLISEIGRQRRKLLKEKTIRTEIIACIRKRNDILLEIFNAYQAEIDRINASQSDLVIKINFKGDKTKFMDQLRLAFKGSGISEMKYTTICDTFADMVAVVQDVLMENGNQLRPLITTPQYDLLAAKMRENFETLIEYNTPNLVEIYYHGKPLNQHSMGQRASALVLFILSQDDNDVIIIDQPEDDLDNQVVYTEFIKRLKKKKLNTQFIFVTHNPNIPVLGDAEKIIAADSVEDAMCINSGTIDSKESHQQIIDIMEGGYEAFKLRNTIYTSWKHQLGPNLDY